MKSYTVNTEGNNVNLAKEYGYHAYYANGITAIEIRAENEIKAEYIAQRIIGKHKKVYYVFE